MLTTGVDAKNVRNVVLTAPIRSMTEFKQIIGRGTRVFEGKDFFTIFDFVGATNLFYDKEWDDNKDKLKEDIEDIIATDNELDKDKPDTNQNDYELQDNQEDKVSDIEGEYEAKTSDEKQKNEKVIIDIKGKKLKVINIETTYVGDDGKPLKTNEYLELLIGILGKFYNDEQGLREIWSSPKNRKDLLNKLGEMNIDESQLNDLKEIFEAQNSDIYDVLSHISFNLDIKTRSERVIAVESSTFVEKYHNEKAKEFIEFILERYKKDGVKEFDEDKLSDLVKLSGFDRSELRQSFGNYNIRDEYFGLQREIYK